MSACSGICDAIGFQESNITGFAKLNPQDLLHEQLNIALNEQLKLDVCTSAKLSC